MGEETHDQCNHQMSDEYVNQGDIRGKEQILLSKHVVDHNHWMNQIGCVGNIREKGETSPGKDIVDQRCQAFVTGEDNPGNGQGPSAAG